MGTMREDRQTVEVPPGTNRAGFLLALEEILKLPRVQNVAIDSKGVISYTRILLEGETSFPIKINFETLSPYHVIRNSRLIEVHDQTNLLKSLVRVFNMISEASLFPLCFVGSPNGGIWNWMSSFLGIEEIYQRETLFGLPYYTDPLIEEYMLFLCAGYTREAAIADTQRSFKLLIPGVTQ